MKNFYLLYKHLGTKEKYEKAKESLKLFGTHLHQEGIQTKEAYEMLHDSIHNKKKLTKEEKEYIGNQLKDVLKTVGLVGMTVLPGGSVFFILVKLFKWNKYIMPSAFVVDIQIK